MADARAPNLSFGLSVTPTAAAYPEIVAQVLVAEQVGLDLVGIQDHPYQRRFLDTFALIADLLARTSTLAFFPDVANLPMRGPTMIAKAAASLDVMSGGRFELGIGAGGFWDAVAGMGGPRRTARESIDALEEAVTIIRAVLDGERVVRSPGPEAAARRPARAGDHRHGGVAEGARAEGRAAAVGRYGASAADERARAAYRRLSPGDRL